MFLSNHINNQENFMINNPCLDLQPVNREGDNYKNLEQQRVPRKRGRAPARKKPGRKEDFFVLLFVE